MFREGGGVGLTFRCLGGEGAFNQLFIVVEHYAVVTNTEIMFVCLTPRVLHGMLTLIFWSLVFFFLNS